MRLMVATIPELVDDLAAEHDDLDRLVAGLASAEWDLSTPAEGWSIKDQIGHLAYFDEVAELAATDADGFAALLEAAIEDPDDYVERATDRARATGGAEVLAWWRDARSSLVVGLADLDPEARVPWFGPPMGARSFVTARLMETWAHGQDVVDTLDATREPTDRLLHVAHLGVRTRPFSYAVRGRSMPDADVRVELTSPGGDEWAWGEPGAADVVRGPALDVCLLVTQRRHVDDTDLEVTGDAAAEWTSIAQAFAGGPSPGRQPAAG